ncbi:F5/8 type C domain containing protein [Streptococcus varani]|uniref:F5/8 type C domain containing protein n=1 Tax=Streptococcus varani TaxID=1608583 RepID=A0A0E4CSU6_9STRE|nr:alpha-N-acetylgalactosaminidase [Streptococcus varani]CQR24963.1 F5/8 type C domain containing protein [Streptococcus varani]
MKIENQLLSRYFVLRDKNFYTSHIVNKQRDMTITNLGQQEFKLVFCDGEEYGSEEFAAHVVEETDATLLVHFCREDVKLNILYSAREDVIAKEVTIYQSDKTINYIDVETLDFETTDGIFYPKQQENIKEMSDFPGYYVELGQPVYAKSLFLGMEFPMSENRVQDKHYFSRYYIGHEITEPKRVWPTIIGASKDSCKTSIQKDFFLYIDGIAQPSYFRKQYNSWYDHMTAIDEDIILKSFSEIYHGFEDHGVHLDAYVVDDGWCDYQSVWEFNEKFPSELKNVKNLVNKLGSSLGLWIGPRGGYNGTEVIMSDWLSEHPEFGSKNALSNDVNIADFNYLKKMKQKMLDYQKEYDISYWKIDGWLLKPDKNDCSGNFAMHTMTPVYEFLIGLLTDLRAERSDRDCWLNLTSYVNPSPWFLQWVNSLWIQISQDVGFTENAGNDINRMITYRDIQYKEFLDKRDIQLPLWALYNHEPVYATTAHTWYMDHQMYASVEEFEDYLMFIATRGNAFWEFHYSYSMFDEARWEANARAVKWIEEHYSTLKHSHRIGGDPEQLEVYGYRCQHPISGEEILSLRNPSDTPKAVRLADIDFTSYQIIKGVGNILVHDEMELPPYSILLLRK